MVDVGEVRPDHAGAGHPDQAERIHRRGPGHRGQQAQHLPPRHPAELVHAGDGAGDAGDGQRRPDRGHAVLHRAGGGGDRRVGRARVRRAGGHRLGPVVGVDLPGADDLPLGPWPSTSSATACAMRSTRGRRASMMLDMMNRNTAEPRTPPRRIASVQGPDGPLRVQARHGPRRRRRELRDPRRRDAGPGRRNRLRQERHGAVLPPAPADPARHLCQRDA